MEAAEKQLRRLVALDAAMATPEGVNATRFAKEHDVSVRTVTRLVDSIEAMGMIIDRSVVYVGATHFAAYRYVGGRRLFSMHVHRVSGNI
jgi:predicted DNA-binding transcriptional regulator YafY